MVKGEAKVGVSWCGWFAGRLVMVATFTKAVAAGVGVAVAGAAGSVGWGVWARAKAKTVLELCRGRVATQHPAPRQREKGVSMCRPALSSQQQSL